MKSLLPSKPGTAYEAQHTGRAEAAMDEARRTAAAPGPLASFSRFVLCGGGVGLASGPAVALLATLMPWASANALVTAGSTILCTELHARFTFKAGRRAGWRRHWQSAGSASAAYTVTCAAMFVLHLHAAVGRDAERAGRLPQRFRARRNRAVPRSAPGRLRRQFDHGAGEQPGGGPGSGRGRVLVHRDCAVAEDPAAGERASHLRVGRGRRQRCRPEEPASAGLGVRPGESLCEGFTRVS